MKKKYTRKMTNHMNPEVLGDNEKEIPRPLHGDGDSDGRGEFAFWVPGS